MWLFIVSKGVILLRHRITFFKFNGTSKILKINELKVYLILGTFGHTTLSLLTFSIRLW